VKIAVSGIRHAGGFAFLQQRFPGEYLLAFPGGFEIGCPVADIDDAVTLAEEMVHVGFFQAVIFFFSVRAGVFGTDPPAAEPEIGGMVFDIVQA